MVAAFLKAEIRSERFGAQIMALLGRDGVDARIVHEPDTDDGGENAYRIRLLGEFRGYRQDRDLFQGFPDDVSWHRALIHRAELARVRYIDYSYWNEISGGSRLPVDAAEKIRAGIVVFGQSTTGFLEMARALRNGAVFPELIFVGADPTSPLVVLEGHVRLTAYFLAPECIPTELDVLVGFSPGIKGWE
jgi:hypothetical protein